MYLVWNKQLKRLLIYFIWEKGFLGLSKFEKPCFSELKFKLHFKIKRKWLFIFLWFGRFIHIWQIEILKAYPGIEHEWTKILIWFHFFAMKRSLSKFLFKLTPFQQIFQAISSPNMDTHDLNTFFDA